MIEVTLCTAALYRAGTTAIDLGRRTIIDTIAQTARNTTVHHWTSHERYLEARGLRLSGCSSAVEKNQGIGNDRQVQPCGPQACHA